LVVTYRPVVSTPFSYSCRKDPKDAEDQLEAISGAAHAMKKSHGTQFTVSPVSRSLSLSVMPSFPDGSAMFDTTQVSRLNNFYPSRPMQFVLSRAPGNIVDWMYKKMGVKYSFAAHLRDTGTVSPGFNPKKNIGSSPLSSVWFCSPRAMDTTGRRRNNEDDRVSGRFYRGHRKGVPLNLSPRQNTNDECISLPSLNRLVTDTVDFQKTTFEEFVCRLQLLETKDIN
jgi:hypothetical protein